MDRLKIRLENIGLVLSIMTKFSLFLGGLIFLVYCSSTGAFPENISLGDGVWLLLIISVFAIGMGTVYFFLGCFGVSLWAIAYHIFRILRVREHILVVRQWVRERKTQKLMKKKPVFHKTFKVDKPFNYKVSFPGGGIAYYGLSLLTLAFMLGAVKENHLDWYLRLISSSILLGFLFLFLHANKQKYSQIEHIEASEDESRRLKGEIKFANVIFTVAVLILTTLYVGLINIAAEKTMIFLHIRSENVTVFVKQPWDSVLDRHLLRSKKYIKNNNDIEKKALLPGYKQYDNMTVSLYNLGSSVFLQFNMGKKSYSLKIPSSDIIVDSVPMPEPDIENI